MRLVFAIILQVTVLYLKILNLSEIDLFFLIYENLKIDKDCCCRRYDATVTAWRYINNALNI